MERMKQYKIYKIDIEKLIQKENKKIKIVPLTLKKREALENGQIVKIQSNQLTNKIFDYFAKHNIPNFGADLSNVLVNIQVPTDAKRRGEKEYELVAKQGFTLNGKHFTRLFSGSGQIRRNTVTFIRDDLYEPIFNSLLCGLTLEDFGDDFSAAKFNAYAGLNMSGCHLLPKELSPKICVIDDFENIRPHKTVNYVTEENARYITLQDEDYILTDNQTEYRIDGDIATRISDGTSFTIRKGVKKHIQEVPYDEIPDSPPLNSFDGQGLMSPEWAERVSLYLGYESFIPSELIIRAPWLKGLLVTMPFHEWFLVHGISRVTDVFGEERDIKDIDCFVSKSQFKMAKVYKRKCEALGVNAWDYYIKAMDDNNLLFGVTKTNNRVEDNNKSINYQYLQALQLTDAEIEELCEPTKEFLRKLNSGDIEEVFENLVVCGSGFIDDATDEDSSYKKLFQRVIEANPDFINDKHIRELIFKECEVKRNYSKIGKLLVNGNYQFCVSDPMAQMEWIAKNHCGKNIEVKGVIPEGHVYSEYWLNADNASSEIVLMRSPLIDRNEIAKRKLIQEREHYFRYLSSGIVYSIHDLTALQMGGCDFDGDIVFSTDNPIILSGCCDYDTAKPLYYTLGSTSLVGEITQDNIIQADIRGLNSKVGGISNKACSLYAKLQKYDVNSPEYKKLYDSIIVLGQVVGQEIDRIKTAIQPSTPLEWDILQAKKGQNRDGDEVQIVSDEEFDGVRRHNELTPDLKPYFFRYVYGYIDDNLKHFTRSFNTVTTCNYGLKLPDFLTQCANGKANERQTQLFNQYIKAYPVIDTDCICNKVCHIFEDFEKSLKKQTISEGLKMLQDFVVNRDIDNELIDEAKAMIESYQRYKRFLVKATNTNRHDTNKDKAKSAFDSLANIRQYYQDKILDLTGGDLQLAFDSLITAAEGNETIVWDIMDDRIIRIIRKVAKHDYF